MKCMTDFESQVLSDLGALKSQMSSLLGVGQPGRLHSLEQRVERHDRTVQRMKGIGGGLGVVVTLFNVAMHLLRK